MTGGRGIPPAVPYQVDHKPDQHPPRQDYAFVTAWADALLLNSERLEAERLRISLQSGLEVETLDVLKVGLTLAMGGLDDGSCIHLGSLRTSRLVGLSRELTHEAMRILRGSGWLAIQHMPTKTSPTVHRLCYPKGVQK